jgi:hypothetical protein
MIKWGCCNFFLLLSDCAKITTPPFYHVLPLFLLSDCAKITTPPFYHALLPFLLSDCAKITTPQNGGVVILAQSDRRKRRRA